MSNLIKDIPDREKPRERLIINGVKNISNEELLAIILRTGTKNKSVKDISMELLNEIKDITNLKDYSYNKYMEIKGLGKVKALTLCAAVELGRRVYLNHQEIINFSSTTKVYNYFKDYFKSIYQEEFYVLYLDSKNNLIEKKMLFKGTLNESTVHPREIFKYAYFTSSNAIICVHNHPSGNATPSSADNYFTNRLISIGKLLEINVLDHIIIGNNNYYSYLEHNKIR